MNFLLLEALNVGKMFFSIKNGESNATIVPKDIVCLIIGIFNVQAEALKIAADNTVESIALTIADPDHENYGVRFERAIPKLLKTLGDC